MIKIYVMSTCPDCTEVKRAAAGDARFRLVDIGEHVRNLKEFLRLRDVHPKFEVARRRGLVGIPVFVKEDGTVTFKPEEVGLQLRPEVSEPASGIACNLDGSGC